MPALPTSPLVRVEEYLNHAYGPDVEFVDGVLVERNVGDWLHSLIQSNVLFALRRGESLCSNSSAPPAIG
ncbi:MAG: hypothetical protein ACLQVN_18390 [Bryobacteraceae bacterium]